MMVVWTEHHVKNLNSKRKQIRLDSEFSEVLNIVSSVPVLVNVSRISNRDLCSTDAVLIQ